MSKNKVLIIVFGVFLLLSVSLGISYFLIKNKQTGTTGSLVSRLLPQDGGETSLLSYSDPAGFSFQYPSELEVKDVTPDDNAYYSWLTLSKPGETKTVKIIVKDTPYKGVSELVKQDKSFLGATLIGVTILSGMSASQYSLNLNLYSLAIDQGVLFQIEGPQDGKFWEEAQAKIISSFSLGPKTAESKDASLSDTIYEAEEIIE